MINDQAMADSIYEQGFYLLDNFLDATHYHALRYQALELLKTNRLKPAKIGHQNSAVVHSDIRRDAIHWLDDKDDNKATQAWFSAIELIAKQLNQHLFIGINDFESHFACYEAGAFYKKHIDQFNQTQDRQMSCVYYLNEQWSKEFGGELILYDKNDKQLLSVLPIANRLICFRSDLPHEVTKTTQCRLSIAGWMKVRSLAK